MPVKCFVVSWMQNKIKLQGGVGGAFLQLSEILCLFNNTSVPPSTAAPLLIAKERVCPWRWRRGLLLSEHWPLCSLCAWLLGGWEHIKQIWSCRKGEKENRGEVSGILSQQMLMVLWSCVNELQLHPPIWSPYSGILRSVPLLANDWKSQAATDERLCTSSDPLRWY